MAVSGLPEPTGRCPDCGDTVYYNTAAKGYLHTLGQCRVTHNTHRHHTFVDHQLTDHNHGACSDHAHWAYGYHTLGTHLEISTPDIDPLGWRRNDIAEGNVWPEEVA